MSRQASLAAAVLGFLPALAAAQWSRDINPGAGPELIEAAQPELAQIVRAATAARGALIEQFAARHGGEWMEAWKRFRNPELKALFLKLLEDKDWHVAHRALFALGYFGDAAIVKEAWPFLQHAEPRMREQAAIVVLRLWEKGPLPGDLEVLVNKEEDFHVRRCLEALKLRIQGKLKRHKVSDEFRVTGSNGLVSTPFLEGMDKVGQAAPGYVAKPNARQAGGSTAKLAPAGRWTLPLLGFGKEEVSGVSVQPFANLRQNGTVYHTGTDVGACIEGAGFYSCAEGIVKLVHTGSDMGTLIVVEHLPEPGRPVCALSMHGGDTVFVEAGDRVVCGQLLGTMGLGFSIENGGHFAHLHFGLYPGPFILTHNYGYKPVKAGLADWFDPAKWLPRQIERTRPLLGDLRPLSKRLDRTVGLATRGEYARAWAEANALRDGAETPADLKDDAAYLAGELERVPQIAVERGKAVLAAGHPNEAVKGMKEVAPQLAGLPGADAVREQLGQWDADPLIGKALKGEARIDTVEKKALTLKDPAQVRAVWEALLKDLGDTCLKERIAEKLQ